MSFLTKLCRLCTSDKDVSLTLNNWDSDINMTFLNKLHEIVPGVLEVCNELPNGICAVCIAQLNEAYKFIKRCFKSQTVLKRYLRQIQNGEITTPSIQKIERNMLNLEKTIAYNYSEQESNLKDKENIDSARFEFINVRQLENETVTRKDKCKTEEIDNLGNNIAIKKEENCEFNESYEDTHNVQVKCEIIEENDSENMNEVYPENSKTNNIEHIFSETTYLCEICEQAFDDELELEEHVKTHKKGKITSINLLPEKSRKKYEMVYKLFMDWRIAKNVSSFCENVILAYFVELAEKYKSSSLWAHYSMLRSTLLINHTVNIENYAKLRAFLKRKSEGYQPKKAKTFTPDEINKFILHAPNDTYLAMKVALIMGIMGACRANELHSMNVEDCQDLGSAILVTIPNTKTKNARRFTITGNFYQIFRKYSDLRPANVASTSFFLHYQNGKCTTQRIGINKFGSMGKQIAKFLRLPNPEMYTGHSFRRSSATLHVDETGLSLG